MVAAAAFLDAFQKVADLATGARGEQVSRTWGKEGAGRVGVRGAYPGTRLLAAEVGAES